MNSIVGRASLAALLAGLILATPAHTRVGRSGEAAQGRELPQESRNGTDRTAGAALCDSTVRLASSRLR